MKSFIKHTPLSSTCVTVWPVLTLDEVAQRLEPLHPTFCAAHLGAAARLRKVADEMPEVIAPLNTTERANFLHGQVRDLVSVGVEEIAGAQVTEWDLFTVAVGGDLLVRFKFLGNGEPANVLTEQQRLLARQRYKEEAMAVLALAGIEMPPTTVTCGYTLDGFDIAKVTIRRDCSGHQTWLYDIYGGDEVAEPLLLPGMKEAKPAVVRSARDKQRADEVDASEG